jgi:hypothetical protein
VLRFGALGRGRGKRLGEWIGGTSPPMTVEWVGALRYETEARWEISLTDTHDAVDPTREQFDTFRLIRLAPITPTGGFGE